VPALDPFTFASADRPWIELEHPLTGARTYCSAPSWPWPPRLRACPDLAERPRPDAYCIRAESSNQPSSACEIDP
jgi:hypothetical protein